MLLVNLFNNKIEHIRVTSALQKNGALITCSGYGREGIMMR